MMDKKYLRYSSGLIACLIALVIYCISTLPDGSMRLSFLDVGQGDAIFLSLPDGGSILIDGGPDEKVMRELTDILPFYQNNIDTIILTHPHPDHVTGLVSVLEKYDVENVILTGAKYYLPAYNEFLAQVKDKNIRVNFAEGSRDFKVGNVVLDVVYPPVSIQGREFSNMNNSSLVVKIIYGKEKILFMGDLETEGEQKLIESGADLSADLIKIGHHGSRTASGKEFIQLVAPRTAIISCGAGNKYKHPHIETMNTLRETGIEIRRTDLEGRINYALDGGKAG